MIFAPFVPHVGSAQELDAWEGYPAARSRLFDCLEQDRIADVAVLTGDIHSSWALDLPRSPLSGYDHATGDGSLAVEIITPAITSSPFFSRAGVRERSATFRSASPHMKYMDGEHHGYVTLDITAARLQADWYHVRTITERTRRRDQSRELRVRARLPPHGSLRDDGSSPPGAPALPALQLASCASAVAERARPPDGTSSVAPPMITASTAARIRARCSHRRTSDSSGTARNAGETSASQPPTRAGPPADGIADRDDVHAERARRRTAEQHGAAQLLVVDHAVRDDEVLTDLRQAAHAAERRHRGLEQQKIEKAEAHAAVSSAASARPRSPARAARAPVSRRPRQRRGDRNRRQGPGRRDPRR